jgi:hypothetical protein
LKSVEELVVTVLIESVSSRKPVAFLPPALNYTMLARQAS